MLKLRKAVETDFDTFKILYENDSKTTDYQWLYYDYKAEIERREPTEEERAQLEREWGKDFLEILDQEYKNYSIERFKKDLESNFIYMIERESEILGYISMFFLLQRKI